MSKRPGSTAGGQSVVSQQAEAIRAEAWSTLLDGRVQDAIADVPDVRDLLYMPKLTMLRPTLLPWVDDKDWWSDARVRDQGQHRSCVGHALAAAIDHLRAHSLHDSRKEPAIADTLDRPYVSWQMLYHTAKFHDEWTGEDYNGSSVRGGIKGFFYNGVCTIDDEKPLVRQTQLPGQEGQWSWYMTKDLMDHARAIQLGAYYRVRQRLPDMHAALNEGRILVVTAYTHDGWLRPAADTAEISVPRQPRARLAIGGMHAFVVVGYDATGFWVQNSWGPQWGRQGLARWLYEDWAANVCDAWALQLAVLPGKGPAPRHGIVTAHGSRVDRTETHFLGQRQTDHSGPSRLDVLGHLVPFRDGLLDQYGPYNVNSLTLDETFRIVGNRCSAKGEKRFKGKFVGPDPEPDDLRYRHVLIYFLGGWANETSLANKLTELIKIYRRIGIYPFFVVWETALFKELELLVQRDIAAVLAQSPTTPNARRAARDRLIEGRIAVPGNRLLRELRRSARRIFLLDQPDPDFKTEPEPTQGNGAYCMGELFKSLAPRYRQGSISYHFAAHGFGAQVLAECLEQQHMLAGEGPSIDYPTISSCTLISPILASDRVLDLDDTPKPGGVLASVLGRGDRRKRRARSDQLTIQRLRLFVLGDQATRLDRFSDDYASAWPELWKRVMALDPKAVESKRTQDGNGTRQGHVLPLLADPMQAERLVTIADDLGLDAHARYVASREDDADSSLHHELGFHPSILNAMAQEILGVDDSEETEYFGSSRRIDFDLDPVENMPADGPAEGTSRHRRRKPR